MTNEPTVNFKIIVASAVVIFFSFYGLILPINRHDNRNKLA